MESVISVKNLKKLYGNITAVDNISFDVEKGSIFGLLGHNGAGKSTTIECILGTKTFDEGSVTILSQKPTVNRKELFQKVGVQFQNTAHQYKIKVKEICEINHSLYKNPIEWKEMLNEFGLINKENAFVTDLSGGEKQKLYIILAVMHKPELTFLDELTSGLDPKARRDVWKYIQGLKEKGTTIFLTSHYMDEVESLCDKVAILKQGKIIIQGTVKQIVKDSGKKNMDEAFLHYVEEESI